MHGPNNKKKDPWLTQKKSVLRHCKTDFWYYAATYFDTLEIDVMPYLLGLELPPRIDTKAS